MMPTFPLPPLKFRMAGFRRYGFKAGCQTRPSQRTGLPSSFVLFAAIVIPCSVSGTMR
jgi:hypothetical protein